MDVKQKTVLAESKILLLLYEMGFDVGVAINDAADKIVSSERARTIASSPIYTAILLAACIFFIMIFVFRDVDAEETVAILAARGSFYVFVVLLGSLFIHNRILLSDNLTEQTGTKIDELFQDSGRGEGVVGVGSNPGQWDTEVVPVVIQGQI